MSVVIFLMNIVFIDILRMPAVLLPPTPHTPPLSFTFYFLFVMLCFKFLSSF